MEQLFWRSNENREKARFLRRWEIFSRPKTSASEGRRIKLPCGSDKILLGSQFRRPRFLAKISNASQKWSLFLGVSEGLFLAKNSNALYTKSLRVSEKTVPSFLAKISNASQKSSLFLGVREGLLFAKISNASHKSSLFLVWKEVIGIRIFRGTFGTLKSARPKFGVLPKGRFGPTKVAPTRFARTPNEFIYSCFITNANVLDCTVETVPTNRIWKNR
jgi:hypothetical protein